MWFEELPEQCPPATAVPPNNEVFYRLIEQEPAQCKDFWSHRKVFGPTKEFKTSECRARSVSMYTDAEPLTKLLRMPAHAAKKIASVTLPPEAGVVLQTGDNRKHYSWWRASEFDVLARSRAGQNEDTNQ